MNLLNMLRRGRDYTPKRWALHRLCLLALIGSLAGAKAQAAADPVAPPRLFPDYAGIVLPPNIAPLNFRIDEPGVSYRIELRSTHGAPLQISSRSASIRLPLRPWRELLQANAGQPLCLDVSAQDRDQRWRRFETVTNSIALEGIDECLVYRRLNPLYNVYVKVGIYQRDLRSFQEQPVLRNEEFGGGCLNCHTFLNQRPETFALNFRTQTNGNPMLLVCSNEVARVDKTMGYLSWHPSGRLLAFSANKLSLFFHTTAETRDVFDAASNLNIYRVDSNVVVSPPAIGLPKRNETWPAWSPDGRHLYYCSAPAVRIERFRQNRYDLMRVGYDLDRDQWGEPEVLVSAQDSALSANQPKVSPDGRFVLFCLCPYGSFPVYQPGSDLYVLDLGTGRHHRLDINSPQAESWHAWSSNSRWVVFSSKRLDGLLARPFFSYVDRQGQFHKPFVLPQADPAYYETCLQTFNVPELVTGPVAVKSGALARRIVAPAKAFAPASPAGEQPSDSAAGEGQSAYPRAPHHR